MSASPSPDLTQLLNLRVGQGYDVHQFETAKELRLGGIAIPYHSGLKGHSDGDALLHAIIDALLGATSLGDIGEHFPDTDPKWSGVDSTELFLGVVALLAKNNWKIINIDSTVVAEEPKLSPHKEAIIANIARLSNIDRECVGLKATTNEKMGYLGAKEGLLALATVLVFKES